MRRWFLPQSPDLIGLLARQGQVTAAGVDALCAWARGDASQEAEVRAREHDADHVRRELLGAVTRAFITSVSPEDVFEISERLDRVLNAAKNLVRESALVAMAPDPPMAEMCAAVGAGVHQLVLALPDLAGDRRRCTDCADAAVREQRAIEHIYRRAMSALLDVDEIREVTGRRELYRRCARMGDAMEAVADRIWYAVVKLG